MMVRTVVASNANRQGNYTSNHFFPTFFQLFLGKQISSAGSSVTDLELHQGLSFYLYETVPLSDGQSRSEKRKLLVQSTR